MKTNNRKSSPVRMADGGIVPVHPASLKGIAQSAGSLYGSARSGLADAFERVGRTFGPPPGYTPAVAPTPAAAPVVTAPPAAPQLGGMNLGVIQRREAAAGLRDGTAFLDGPGGPTDDKIDAKLSHGEAVLPADTVQAVGPENIQGLIDATHTPVKSKGLRHFANGIPGIDVFEPFDPKARAALPEPKIPGIEVRYGPPGISDPGPGNPNVNRMGPPRPPAAPTVAPAAAPAVPQTQPQTRTSAVRNFLTGGSRDVGGAMRSVGGGVGSAVKLAAKGQAALAPVIAAPIIYNTPTEKYEERFGTGFDPNSPGARIAGALGLGENEQRFAADVGTRLLGAASDVANVATGSLAGNLFRDKQNATDVTPRPVQAPAATAAAPQTQTDVQRGGAAPAVSAATPLRTNSFGNVQGDTAFDNRGPVSAQNLAAADALAQRSQAEARVGLRGGMDDNLPAGFGVTIPESQAVQELEARNATVRSTIGDRDISPRTRVAMERNAIDREQAEMRDATERRGQDMTDAGFARRDRVTLRGQDLDFQATTRGQDSRARTETARAQREQMNTDRQFQFDRQKHGDTVARQNFESRQSAQKAMTERITSMLPPGPDGKPDTANVARYMTGLNAIVSQRQQLLEQRAAQGDARAVAALDDLSRNGVGALDERTVRSHIQGMKVNDLRAQYGTGGLNPVGGTDVATDTPASGLRKTSEGLFGFGGEYTVVGPQGESLGTIPSRAVEGDGSFFGGKKRTDLRDFIQ